MTPTPKQLDRMDREAAREKRVQAAIVELKRALRPHDDVLWHLEHLLGFKVESTPIQFTSIASSAYGGMTMTAKHRREVMQELQSDARPAVFSESFLYNLLGKGKTPASSGPGCAGS